MSEITKMIAIGIIAVIIIIILKQYRPEFAIYISIIAGMLILIMAIQKMEGIITLIQSISNKAGVNGKFLSIIFINLIKLFHSFHQTA